jgi:hypothetical protein
MTDLCENQLDCGINGVCAFQVTEMRYRCMCNLYYIEGSNGTFTCIPGPGL